MTLGLNYIHYLYYILKLKPNFSYQLTYMCINLYFPLTIMDIIMNDRDLPSHAGSPSPGDCHLSYIHGRLSSSTWGRNTKMLI